MFNIFDDFSLVLENLCAVNRQKSNNEVNVSKLIEDNNKILNLVDTFCTFNPVGGFTSVRDMCGIQT